MSRKFVVEQNGLSARALSPPDGGGVDVYGNSRQICVLGVKNFKERWVLGEWNILDLGVSWEERARCSSRFFKISMSMVWEFWVVWGL